MEQKRLLEERIAKLQKALESNQRQLQAVRASGALAPLTALS